MCFYCWLGNAIPTTSVSAESVTSATEQVRPQQLPPKVKPKPFTTSKPQPPINHTDADNCVVSDHSDAAVSSQPRPPVASRTARPQPGSRQCTPPGSQSDSPSSSHNDSLTVSLSRTRPGHTNTVPSDGMVDPVSKVATLVDGTSAAVKPSPPARNRHRQQIHQQRAGVCDDSLS